MTDFLEDALMHSWGKKPEQKAAEKEYNKQYYQEHKAEIRAKRIDKLSQDASEARFYSNFRTGTIKSDVARGAAKNESAKAAKQYHDAHDRLWKYAMAVDALPVAACEAGKTFVSELINW